MANLRKNFKNIEHLDDNVLAFLSFRDISSNEGKKDKQNKFLTEKLAENYEKVKKFPTKVEAGEDSCTDRAHDARFLRGYVGNSQELWVQARQKLGLTGLDPIANYETVSVGINGFISARVWHEVHSPSSKHLSIRMFTSHALKSTWASPEKGGEVIFTELYGVQEDCYSSEGTVPPENFSDTNVQCHHSHLDVMQRVKFFDLASFPDRLTVLADFIDEILKFNAQAWDEERFFMSAQEITAKWSAILVRKNVTRTAKPVVTASRKKVDKNSCSGKPKDTPKYAPGVCKLFNKGTCTHPGDKHGAPWNSSYVLKHCCAKFLPDKASYCLEPHAEKDHK